MKSTIMPSLAFERKWYAMPLGSGMFSTLANGKSADFPGIFMVTAMFCLAVQS